MSFKKNSYIIIKNAIDPKIAGFVYRYFSLKKKVVDTFHKTKYISPFATEWGVYTDSQAPNTYSHYSDIAMDTLLIDVLPIMEKHTKLKLIPTYSYARLYKKGDILKRHKDRMSCEISTTLNLGGDPWPIFIEPDSSKGYFTDNNYVSENTKGVKVNLNPGDMLVYKGCMLEHWRDEFKGENCGQVFLHYNDATGPYKIKYDERPHLGLPSWYRNKKL